MKDTEATREDAIRKRLEKIEADPGQGTPIRLVYPIDQSSADLRYLLEKVERLENLLAPYRKLSDTAVGTICDLLPQLTYTFKRLVEEEAGR